MNTSQWHHIIIAAIRLLFMLIRVALAEKTVGIFYYSTLDILPKTKADSPVKMYSGNSHCSLPKVGV